MRTTSRAGVLLATFVIAVTLSACGPVGASNNTAAPHPTTTILPLTRCAQGVKCITSSANGTTVRIKIGTVIEFFLKNANQQFSPLRETGKAITHRGATINKHHVIIEEFTASHVGRASIEASESPICSPGTACPQYILLWKVGIVVAAK